MSFYWCGFSPTCLAVGGTIGAIATLQIFFGSRLPGPDHSEIAYHISIGAPCSTCPCTSSALHAHAHAQAQAEADPQAVVPVCLWEEAEPEGCEFWWGQTSFSLSLWVGRDRWGGPGVHRRCVRCVCRGCSFRRGCACLHPECTLFARGALRLRTERLGGSKSWGPFVVLCYPFPPPACSAHPVTFFLPIVAHPS